MPFSIAMIGAGQFSGSFANLFQLHPGVSRVYATDLLPERADGLVSRLGLAGTFGSFDDAIASPDVDAVVIMTQRWTHGPLVVRALEAGKHVYSAVPMAISAEEIGAIIDTVQQTGLTYMMGETSHYNPAVIWAREANRRGEFGRIFYSEGDYVHDMDHGFYDAYRYSGGEQWKQTASYPPMLYPTHSIGGVLGAVPTHATSVSCIGVLDDRGDGVFDRQVSLWGNEFSNMSAMFHLADGGVMRTNEFRRVGHYGVSHESRFRFYGTDLVMEQGSVAAHYTSRADQSCHDITEQLATKATQLPHGAEVVGIGEALMESFTSGMAPVQDRSRLPEEFAGAPNGHQGAHHFLVDDFVRAVADGSLPPVNAWQAARYTLPGVYAMESAKRDGERLAIDDFGDAPA